MIEQVFLTRENKSECGTVSVIAAAFNGGQPKSGTELAPKRILEAGLKNQLNGLGWKIEADGQEEKFHELKPREDAAIGNLKNPRFVGRVCKFVADRVADCQKQGKFALTIGGDHSLGLGTLAGTCLAWKDKKEPCVIWVDAHADINTPDTSPSGNIHGMPLAWILDLVKNPIEGFEWFDLGKPLLSPSSLVYIGLRDVDEGEKKILKDLNIKAFSMHQIDKYGIGQVVEMALNHVNPKRDRPIHLSFDVDALDPSVAPATGTPVRGGLTFREGHYICEAVHETGCLVAMDLMEVNPTLGDEAQKLQTVQIGCSLIRAALGETLL